MFPTYSGLICGFVCFGAFLVIHVAALHLDAACSPSRSLVLAFAAASLAALLIAPFLVAAEWSAILLAEIYAIMVMACLFILYAPFFFTIYTSLSIQSLLMAMERGGAISLETLYGRYASQDFIAQRLSTMVASGYLVEQDGRYRLTAKGRGIAAVFRSLKRLWRLGQGG